MYLESWGEEVVKGFLDSVIVLGGPESRDLRTLVLGQGGTRAMGVRGVPMPMGETW